jgi:hypothetical protein
MEAFDSERMSGTAKRRLQFSLRRLMLWTAIIALYLGIVGAIQVGPLVSTVLVVYVVFVVVIRMAFGQKLACVSSVVIAGLLFLLFFVASFGRFAAWPLSCVALCVSACGAVYGFLLFAMVELTFRFVEWADKSLQKRP